MIDSLSFIAMPLASFPKTFGLKELKKGYFPHLFNRPENYEYVGPVPAKDYYMPETMSVEGRKRLKNGTTNRSKKVMSSILLKNCMNIASLMSVC